tara:strand:+ start:211 stop:564 length:354 start_codon:yes stop_codon:yes gene_type:complete
MTLETFKIETQYMENYDVDGESAEGHWKFKGNTTYRVTVPMSSHSKQNATAAVQRLLASESNDMSLSYVSGDAERVPTDWLPADDMEDTGDAEYDAQHAQFLNECLEILVVHNLMSV